MKLEQAEYNVTSTMTGEKIRMGIRVEDMPHMMAVVTDLYKNRLLAILREYSTNAWDAHVAARVSLPIEVRLPSPLDPTLRIRDYGIGLDKQDIREVYSQYGRSTKRDTNDQVGMLGLGCKSALTYGSQFTVSSVKGGRRITVLIAREADGAGTMTPLSDTPTDDANGTEVVIAIRREDVGRCEKLAEEFFSYWPADSVLVNGKPPKTFKERATGAPPLRLTDDLYVTHGGDESKIVMGNVAYPATIDLGLGRYSGVHIVAFVPIGSVKPTPSREALMDTQLTKDTLAQIRANYATAVKGAIQREVDKASCHQQAIQIAEQWKTYVPAGASKTYTFRGEEFPASYSRQVASASGGQGGYEYFQIASAMNYGYRRQTQVGEHRELRLSNWPTTMWVTNFTPEKFTAAHRHKLAKHIGQALQEYPFPIERFVLLPDENHPNSPFVDPRTIVDYSTIRRIKLDPKARVPSGRIPGSYNVWTEDGWKEGVPGDELRLNKPIMWFQGNRYEAEQYVVAIKKVQREFTVVCLTANRVAKFQRDVPSAKRVEDVCVELYEKWFSSLTNDQLLALKLSDEGGTPAAYLDAAKVDDPEVREYIRIAKVDITAVKQQRASFRYIVPSSKLHANKAKLPADPMVKYPLYNGRHARHSHTYLYLNAAYAALTNQP